jgi:hypothetical protein
MGLTQSQRKWLAKRPMGAFERVACFGQEARRGDLAANERWLPYAYRNNRYAVQLSEVQTPIGLVLHLWITRHDGEMARSWTELQAIKNELGGGEERCAVEVFPAQSSLINSANMAHLWVLPEGYAMPFTLHAARPM